MSEFDYILNLGNDFFINRRCIEHDICGIMANLSNENSSIEDYVDRSVFVSIMKQILSYHFVGSDMEVAAVENIKQFIVRHCNIVKPNYTRAIALAASDTSSVIEISEDISNIWCAMSHFRTTKTLQALLIRLLSEIYISSGDDSINIGYLKFIEIISCLQIGNPPDSF